MKRVVIFLDGDRESLAAAAIMAGVHKAIGNAGVVHVRMRTEDISHGPEPLLPPSCFEERRRQCR